MKIIKKRKIIEHKLLERYFERLDFPGAGFGFDCAVDGAVNVAKLNPAARISYEQCLNGTLNVKDCGIKEYQWTSVQPALGLCPCNHEIELINFTNACVCGSDYNSAGQLLAPREQWGEETGEAPYECVGPFSPADLE